MNLVIAGSVGFLAGALVVYLRCEALYREEFRRYRDDQHAWLVRQLTRSRERERAVLAMPTYTVRVVKNGDVIERQTVSLN
jgi:hypothetical protein